MRTLGFEQRRADRRQDHRAVRDGRVRRLHAVLLALQVGDRADPDRAADHPAGVRARKADERRRRRSTNTSRTRTKSSTELLPRNIAVQVFRALLENAASEQGARMSAMDNATRNAGEMIRKQTHHLQPHAPGDDHQGTDRDHLRRRGALTFERNEDNHGDTMANASRTRSPRSSAPSSTCSSRAICRRS